LTGEHCPSTLDEEKPNHRRGSPVAAATGPCGVSIRENYALNDSCPPPSDSRCAEMAIPGARRPRFYEKKAPVEAIAVIPPLLAAGVTAVINIRDPARGTLGWVLAGGCVWLVAGSVAKVLNARVQDKEARLVREHAGLTGALYVLYTAIFATMGEADPAIRRLRITVHRVVPRKSGPAEELEQIVPYVGGGAQSGVGRTFSIRSGIIGRAVREKKPFAASHTCADRAQFVQELVSQWGYTEHDAEQVSIERRAWMAIPIFGGPKEVVAVVFLDSDDQAFFTPDLQSFIVISCEAIASYIRETYR
jgi:hypothetical protein